MERPYKTSDLCNSHHRVAFASLPAFVFRNLLVLPIFSSSDSVVRPVGLIELPLHSRPEAIAKAFLHSFFHEPDADERKVGARAFRASRHFAELRPLSTRHDDSPLSCRASLKGIEVQVSAWFNGASVSSYRAGVQMCDLWVSRKATLASFGRTVLEAVQVALNPPASRFPWRSLCQVQMRKEGLLLVSHFPLRQMSHSLHCGARLLDHAVEDGELGKAIFDSFRAVGILDVRTVEKPRSVLFKNKRLCKLLYQEGWPAVFVEFKGAYDPSSLHINGLAAYPGKLTAESKVPADIAQAPLGAAVRKMLVKIGANAIEATATPIPLGKLFSAGGYRGLVISSARKQSSIFAALKTLKAHRMVAWSEPAREIGEPKPCAVRLSDSAVKAVNFLLTELRAISRAHRVDLTMALATRSTDVFVYAHLQGGVTRRVLVYGIAEQHSWSTVSGKPEAWEKDALDGAATSTRSDGIITDAMSCAEAALSAAYQ